MSPRRSHPLFPAIHHLLSFCITYFTNCQAAPVSTFIQRRNRAYIRATSSLEFTGSFRYTSAPVSSIIILLSPSPSPRTIRGTAEQSLIREQSSCPPGELSAMITISGLVSCSFFNPPSVSSAVTIRKPAFSKVKPSFSLFSCHRWMIRILFTLNSLKEEGNHFNDQRVTEGGNLVGIW